MASGNPFFDDIRSKSEVIDPPQSEDMTVIDESVNDAGQSALKPNPTVSSSVRELLECPVCLNAMYPPIHQVDQLLICLFYEVSYTQKLFNCNLMLQLGCHFCPYWCSFSLLVLSPVAVFKWSHIMLRLQAQGSQSMPHL